MDNVFFDPWVGKNYSKGINGVKVLVLGHSHTCGEKCPGCGNAVMREECGNFTQNVVRDYLAWGRGNFTFDRWIKTFVSFERALSGRVLDQQSREEVWNSISFYNLVQTAMDDPYMQPTQEQYLAAQQAFPTVIRELLPDVIIAWGKAYSYAPDLDGYPLESVEYEDALGKLWGYTIDGKPVVLLGIKHPSIQFTWEKWHQVIKTVMNSYASK